MNIKIGKKYRQRDGHIAEIKEIELGLEYPLRGKVCLSDGRILDRSWDLSGRCYGDKESEFDLVEELPAEVSSATAISMDKQYRTIEGQKVRIYCIDGNGKFPVHGAVWEEGHNYWVPFKWTAEGNEVFNSPRKTDRYNLVEVKPRIQREYWANIYPDNLLPALHVTRQKADKGAAPSRIACVKVVIDCEGGEGLE